MYFDILPPIEIDGKTSVIGITRGSSDGQIKINHHTRSIPDNKDQGDFKEISIDMKHLPGLVLYLSKLIKHVENQ